MARFIAPGVARHATQRGAALQIVFLTRADHRVYLNLLREQAGLAKVAILTYYLMPNHVHLILVPPEEDSLAVLLRRGRCDICGKTGSTPVRSGQRTCGGRCATSNQSNPVRAGLSAAPQEFEWSSAEAHLSGQDRWHIAGTAFWREQGGATNWRRLLGAPELEARYSALRKATYAGQPFGEGPFATALRELCHRKSETAGTAKTRRRLQDLRTADGASE